MPDTTTSLPDDSPINLANPWLCEQKPVQQRIWAIVARLKSDAAYHEWEDLRQEGLVHIWRMEQERPGQTVSWYLQNVQFHLRDLLKSGRSLDCAKRWSGRVEWAVDSHKADGAMDAASALTDGRDPVCEICVHDLTQQMRDRLNGLDAAVLELSLGELTTWEIARRLGISLGTVFKRRRAIASVASKLWNSGCE
jgi:DNA-directed RNA polymerase specialized sigma24 family protein